jgi:hypothetical protein
MLQDNLRDVFTFLGQIHLSNELGGHEPQYYRLYAQAYA